MMQRSRRRVDWVLFRLERAASALGILPRGGVSIHHGNTLHQLSANRSAHPRRAVTFYFLRNDAELVESALKYDPSHSVIIS